MERWLKHEPLVQMEPLHSRERSDPHPKSTHLCRFCLHYFRYALFLIWVFSDVFRVFKFFSLNKDIRLKRNKLRFLRVIRDFASAKRLCCNEKLCRLPWPVEFFLENCLWETGISMGFNVVIFEQHEHKVKVKLFLYFWNNLITILDNFTVPIKKLCSAERY